MAGNPLEERVFAIEKMLREYPTRRDLEGVRLALEAQIVQLRLEMRGEFSAVRDEMQGGLQSGLQAVRTEMHAGDEA